MSISRGDVKQRLATIIAPVERNRTRALMSKLFSFALDEEIITTHPCIRLKKQKESSRDRVLSHDELRAFWADTEDMPSTMRAAFRLRLITAQRGKEVTSMRWQDVDLSDRVVGRPIGVPARTHCRIAWHCHPSHSTSSQHHEEADAYSPGASPREASGVRHPRVTREASTAECLEGVYHSRLRTA